MLIPAQSPVLLSLAGAAVNDDPAVMRAWECRFAAERAVAWPGLLDPRLAAMVRDLGRTQDFTEQEIKGVGRRSVETSDRAAAVLAHALSGKSVLDWLGAVAGRGRFESVSGGVACLRAGSGEDLGWHDDNLERRRLAVTIDLSEAPFEGGAFELREKKEGTLLFRHRPAGFGSAMLFHVAGELEHRVLPVTAGGPRLTFSGWFSGRAEA